MPQLTPATSAEMLPTVDTAVRTPASGIALTPVRTTSRSPLYSAAMKVAFAPNCNSPSSRVNARDVLGVIIVIRPNKGINFFTIRDFAKLAIF